MEDIYTFCAIPYQKRRREITVDSIRTSKPASKLSVRWRLSASLSISREGDLAAVSAPPPFDSLIFRECLKALALQFQAIPISLFRWQPILARASAISVPRLNAFA